MKVNKNLTVFVEFTKPLTQNPSLHTYWMGGKNHKDFNLKLNPLNPKKGRASVWYASAKNMTAGRWVINIMLNKERIAYIPIQMGSGID